MSLPVGITTCTVTVGPAYSYSGEEGVISGSVVADRSIVWSATGAPVFKVESVVPPSLAGGQTSFVVPHVNQPGFVNAAGDAITGWYYTFNGRATFDGNRVETISKRFQVLQGQTTVDIDLIPDGPVTPGVTVPAQYVTSVNGQTGAVELAGGGAGVDLDEDLGPFAAGKGLVLTSPDGTKVRRLRIDNTGALVTETIEDDPGGGGGSDPSDIAGLMTWYRTSSLSLSGGDAVTLWPDSTPAGRNATAGPGIANPPLYAINGINGRPAVRFVSASDQAMSVPSALATQKPFTLFFVVGVSDFTENRGILASGNGGAAIRINQSTGRPNFDKAATAGIGTATTGLTAGVGAVVCLRYDNNGAWAFTIDGNPAGSGVADQTLTGDADTTLGRLMNGYLGELILFNAALSPADQANVEDYLRAEWGTP